MLRNSWTEKEAIHPKGGRKDEKDYGHFIGNSSGLRLFEFLLLPLLAGLLPILLGSGVALWELALWLLCGLALCGMALLSTGGNSIAPSV